MITAALGTFQESDQFVSADAIVKCPRACIRMTNKGYTTNEIMYFLLAKIARISSYYNSLNSAKSSISLGQTSGP